MFPVSGAEQLKTSGAHKTRPMISHRGAYSRLVRPAPSLDAGRNRFHSPLARAFGFSASTTGLGDQRSSGPASSRSRRSIGSMNSTMKSFSVF